MNVADHLLARLAAEGITHGFGCYGGAVAEIFDAFTRQTAMKYICPIHESAAGFMAEGFSKAMGRPGFAFATSGPGCGNLVTPIQNFYYDSVPGIFVTGQVQSKFMRPNRKVRQLGFQETPSADIVREITKWSVVVRSAEGFPALLDQAIHLCKSGRPGPILLDICGDAQRMGI